MEVVNEVRVCAQRIGNPEAERKNPCVQELVNLHPNQAVAAQHGVKYGTSFAFLKLGVMVS